MRLGIGRQPRQTVDLWSTLLWWIDSHLRTVPAVLVDTLAQEWRIGSQVPGFGYRIQTDTIESYTEHGDHVEIKSPNPANP